MKIAIGNDHAGVQLKTALSQYLQKKNIEVINFGTDTEESVDYPDFVSKAAGAVQKDEAEFGIVICGTGIGASITANKLKGVHAALCHNVFTAKMARNHNNANVLALGARVTKAEDAFAIVETFLKEHFSGERHKRRVRKIVQMEESSFL